MVDLFHYRAVDFKGSKRNVSIATGPVIISDGKYLLHRQEKGDKLQFIGGRLDDNRSFRENAIYKAKADVGVDIELLPDDPFVVLDSFERNGELEDILLVHYRARISRIGSPPSITDFGWYTLEEIRQLNSDGELTSPNILLAAEHFAEK